MIKMGLHSFVVHNNPPPQFLSLLWQKYCFDGQTIFFYNQHKEEQERRGK